MTISHFSKVRSDPEFIRACSSAEVWQPILDLDSEKLFSFLVGKRSAGYSLVGLEQTNSSVLLGKAELPQKMLLLVGAEREGIPGSLLKLCDMLIEIPQSGLIRSLNAHVATSIATWEYLRQHGPNSRP